MIEVTISSKYQIVIPKDIRRRLNLKAGQKLHLIVKDNMLSLIPEVDVRAMRGILKGIDLNVEREEEDRV